MGGMVEKDQINGVHPTNFEIAAQGMPISVLIWTTLAESTVGEIIKGVTGCAVEAGELEYLCPLEAEYLCPLTNNAQLDDDYEEDILNLEFEDFSGNPLPKGWITRELHKHRTDTPVQEGTQANLGNQVNVCGEVFATQENQTTLPTIPGRWERVRQKAIRITQEMWTNRSINKGVLSQAMTDYITALCDPSVTTILCQGGPGSGKTFTATLVAMLALCEGITTKLLHTKPLVSAGGVGLGFERGSTADKLQYWVRPTKMAMDRVVEMEKIDPMILSKSVESYPIDRTRGLSLPRGEWMIADEMQNCQHSLFGCVATRAEAGSKVVMCGDIEQMDIPVIKSKPGGMQAMVHSWTTLCSQTASKSTTAESLKKAELASQQLIMLQGSFRMIDLGRNCNVRDSKNNVFTNWVMDLSKGVATTSQINTIEDGNPTDVVDTWNYDTREIRQEVKKIIDNSSNSSDFETPVPFFSAFAGLDNLGCGIVKGIPQLITVGGSENNVVAQEAFRLRHGYRPFPDQTRVAPHSLQGIYVVGSGAPCVAYSPAGSQNGTGDPRGLHYVDQVNTYIAAQVPILVLEQVPECQNILHNDYRSRQSQKSPHATIVAQLRAHGYHVPQHTQKGKTTYGILICATDVGGVVDRERLITIAIRNEIWDESKFQWPTLRVKSTRTIREILDKQPEERYVCREDNSIRFDRADKPFEPGRAWVKWFKKDVHHKLMGEWNDPHKIYSIDGPMPSPTAFGNTRWFEYEGPNKECWRRRLSPREVARAMGVEARLITHFGERSAYRLVGNAVAIEVGQAIGETINRMIDRELVRNRTEQWLKGYDETVPKMTPKSEDREVQEDSLRREMMYRIRNMHQHQVSTQGVYSLQTSEIPIKLSDYLDGPTGTESVDWETITQDTDVNSILCSHGRMNSLPSDIVSGQLRIKTAPDTRYIKEQEECPWCHGLRQYLTTAKHPTHEDTQQSSEREKEAHHYCMFQGLLYRKNDRGDGPGLQLCTPSHLRDTVVRMAHNSPVAIHPSSRQMSRMISRRHYWPTIEAHCKRIRDSCSTCAKAGPAATTSAGDQIHYVPIGKPLSVVAIDVVGPMGNKNAATSRGNRYLVTIIDWFTRYVCMYPIAEPTAAAIGQCLAKFTERFGVPLTVVSDGASYFRAESIREFESLLGIRRGYVAEYRAPGNGLLERFHRTLGRQMKIRTYESGTTDWDENCGLMSFAYNSMEHSATGYSPFYLMHGYHPAMPFDVIDPVEEDGFVSKTAWVTEQQRRLNESHTLAYERMQDAAYARLSRSTAKVSEIFKTGDHVYLFIPAVPRGFAKKCTLHWHGPFEVMSEKKGRCYMIKTHRNTRLIHEARLKRAVKESKDDRLHIVDTGLQQEFEELLDQGASVDHDPGWKVVASILNEPPLDNQGSNDLVWLGFKEKPYNTIQQCQKESREPRLDVQMDKNSHEIELTDSIREAMTNLQTITVEYCLHCQKERLPEALQYISVCQGCDHLLLTDPTLRQTAHFGVWYRVAETASERIPHSVKVKECAICKKTQVFVPYSELRRYCKHKHSCLKTKTALSETHLMDTERYFRMDRNFGDTEEDLITDVFTRYPVETSVTPTIEDTIEVEKIIDLEPVIRSDVVTTDHSIDGVSGYHVKGRKYYVHWGDKTKSWVHVMDLIQSPSATAKWLTSVSGRARLKSILGDEFDYTKWSHFVHTTTEPLHSRISRVVSIQLTYTKQKNWATIKSSATFKKGDDIDARFSVWLIPTQLRMTEHKDDIVIPLTEVPFRVLKRLFEPDEWNKRWLDMHKKFNAMAPQHTTVPIYWCHSCESDAEMGLIHADYDRNDGLPASDVFHA